MQGTIVMNTFFLLCVSSAAMAQVFFFGPCPDYPVTRRFKPDRFSGKWYEYEKYFSLFEDVHGGRCPSITFTDKGNGKMIVDNSVAASTGFATAKVTSAEATLLTPNATEAKWKVKYVNNPFVLEGTQWVLETDYTRYAILWSCQDFSFFTFQYLWILTRERRPERSIITRAHDDLEILGLDTNHLRTTNQDQCAD